MGAVNIFGQKQRKNGLSKKPVIKGDFSSYKINYKELRIYKLNKLIASCLLLFVILSMASYMAVVSREVVVKDLHIKTNKIYYENIDLQNKVDNLKSFYAIDNQVSKINFLIKPDKVIEVKAVNNIVPKRKKHMNKHNPKQVPAGF
jgi:hypothetical protein